MVSRSEFHTAVDPRLDYLVDGSSPVEARRNPQTTFELRDLPGAEGLIGSEEPAAHGIVRLGPYTLAVSSDGQAEVRMPAGTALTVRTA